MCNLKNKHIFVELFKTYIIMEKLLFENSFCTINEVNGNWFRTDKILGTTMEVESYWNDGVLIKK